MSFYTDYEIRGAVPGGTVKTFKARQIATSRNVLVHLLGSNPAVLEKLATLPAQKRSHILEQGDRDGTPFVVTDLLDGYASFDSWLTAPVTEDFGSHRSPGEFTQLFSKPASDSKPPAEVRSPSPPAPPPDGGKPGEFTQFFKAPPSPPPAEPLPPAPPSLQPGEFTQFFSGMPKSTRPATPPPANNPPPRSTPQQPAPPGAFTRIFQMTPDRTPASDVLSTPPPAPVRSTGEYTRVFGSTPPVEASAPPPPPPPAPAPPPPKVSGDFTRIFEPPRVTVTPVSVSPVVPQVLPTVTPPAIHYQPPVPVVPSTPYISAPQMSAPQMSPPQMSSAGVSRRTNYLPLVIILGCMLLVAIVLIVYFAMRLR